MTAFFAKLARPISVVLATALWLSSPLSLASSKTGLDGTVHFRENAAPLVVNTKLVQKTRESNCEEFAALHSGVSRTPLRSAEHLTAVQVKAARALKRRSAFHADPRLAPAERAELSDHVRSGYDRGHMAPSGDMPTLEAQQESFSLENMVPQNTKNNQAMWQGIEEAARSTAESDGELYVVTGPLFEWAALERINGGVLVPTAEFKAIYNPAIQRGATYMTPNAPGMLYQTMMFADLEKRSCINLVPALLQTIKSAKMHLPVPMPHGGRSRKPPVAVDTVPRYDQ